MSFAFSPSLVPVYRHTVPGLNGNHWLSMTATKLAGSFHASGPRVPPGAGAVGLVTGVAVAGGGLLVSGVAPVVAAADAGAVGLVEVQPAAIAVIATTTAIWRIRSVFMCRTMGEPA